MSLASFIHRYDEHGGGDLPAFSWAWQEAPPYARLGEVDTLDGFLMVLPPWPCAIVRFDESLGRFHGYDFDFCLQVRGRGPQGRHRRLPRDPPPRAGAVQRSRAVDRGPHQGGREMGRADPGVGSGAGTWVERALRAEAERDAAKLLDHANGLEFEARCTSSRARSTSRRSISWRITAPLRRVLGDRSSGARAGRRRCGPAGEIAGSQDDRLRLLDLRARTVPPLRPAGDPAGGRARLGDLRVRRGGDHRTGYNLLLERGRQARDLEALVIVHPHTEIADPGLRDKAPRGSQTRSRRRRLRGGGPRDDIAWWEGNVSCGHVTQRYIEYGGGELAAYSWTERSPPAEVDTVDGLLLVLPVGGPQPALRRGLLYGHGFDLDFCLQVRAAGRKVVTFDAAWSSTARWTCTAIRSCGSRDTSSSPASGAGGCTTGGGPAAWKRGPAAPRPSARPPGRSPTPENSPRRPRRGAPAAVRRGHRHAGLACHRAAARRSTCCAGAARRASASS